MGYVLEKISTEDQEQIIDELSVDPELKSRFELLKKLVSSLSLEQLIERKTAIY